MVFPLMEKSRVRVPEVVPPPISLLLLFFLIAAPALTFRCADAAGPPISYADHCAAVVPEYAPAEASNITFHISNGYFSGADDLFGDGDRDRLNESVVSRPRSLGFFTQSVRRTVGDGVLQVSGIAYLHGGGGGDIGVRGRRLRYRTGVNFHRPLQPRSPRTFSKWTRMSISLSGYWSETAGKLCMVGNGQVAGKGLELSAVFKLNYLKVSNITSSMIGGTLELFDSANGSIKYDPVTVVAYNGKKYEYTKTLEAEQFCSRVTHTEESLGLGSDSVCALSNYLMEYKLDYPKNCSTGSCSIFPKVANFTPNWMSMNQIQCSDDGRLHMYIGFSNVSSFGHSSIFNPDKSLVGEGIWNTKRNQLCLVACRVLSSMSSLGNASVDECSIRICLWFSAVWTIKDRSTVAGHIWNVGNENDSNYFGMISFWSSRSYIDPVPLTGLKYKYTELDNIRNSCPVGNSKSIGKFRYPDGRSSGDLRFAASVSGDMIIGVRGYFTPVSVGETVLMMAPGQKNIRLSGEDRNNSIMNVSYAIRLAYPRFVWNEIPGDNGIRSILAEGIYNSEEGSLCLVGCRNIISSTIPNQAKTSESMDCQINIKIQLAPLKPETGNPLKGTIRSTRDKKDALYFKPLEIISNPMYKEQAITSMWRMDVEIIMVLCSLTLSCIFIGLQLFHVKRNQEVLPSICITMLTVLTLGHMIPLVLNFEAFFLRSNKSSMFMRTGGWLEVNEVIVRIITMVAFLLQFRLLQVAWSSRSTAEDKDLWVVEKKVLKMCLPLYIAGGLVVLLIHFISSKPQPGLVVSLAAQRHSLWGDAISYGGLVLDGFLLPQIMFNILSNSKEKALAPSFYLGNTIVRGFPHLYDAYRRGHYMSNFRSSYIYANPDEDFYSLVWDMVIPSGALLLAVLLYLQQRFGGRCLLPRRISSSTGYEMVPVISS